MKKEELVWSIPIDQLFGQLDSSLEGLPTAEAKRRANFYGANEVAKRGKKHPFLIFLTQFRNPLIFILVIAAFLSFFLDEKIEALVILSIVLLNAILGFVQEYKAERALRELRKYVSNHAQVLRDGVPTVINAQDLVPGDVIFIHHGDIVPADLRLLDAKGLMMDESSLTGESLPLRKSAGMVASHYSLPQDLRNMTFMGTVVAAGTAKGVVTTIGEKTVLGRTAHYLKEDPGEGEFQKNIRVFSNFLLKIILIMTLLIFAANALLDKGILTSFLFAIALAVGITPEVLPIIMTITLSNGALQLAKEKVITKRLSSIETLGDMDILCSDKTGTLTEGKMALEDFVDINGKRDYTVLTKALVCTPLRKQKRPVHIEQIENPIDHALWESPQVKRVRQEYDRYTFIAENEFDFERRRMSILVHQGKKNILILKGALESILPLCTSVQKDAEVRSVTSSSRNTLRTMAEEYEKEGYKVIALAEKTVTSSTTSNRDETHCTLLGFLLFLDPPKKTARKSLQLFQQSGVNIKILTGDSAVVTRKICRDVGLAIAEKRIITGEELENLSELKFKEYCLRYNVFARISPEQKYKIVRLIKEQGHVVGFLGDGINDAPALHTADVGISVDTGTGIAKEAADIILVQKSLQVLAHGIITGRKTFGNIMKYIFNTISANFGNMSTLAISSLFLKFIPLLPSQILLGNFLSDFPLLTISKDNVDEEFIKKPKHWDLKLISRFMFIFGALSSFFDLCLILPLIFVVKAHPELFRTSWFLLSLLSEVVITFAIRTRLRFFHSKPNAWLVVSSILITLVSVSLIYLDLGQKLFFFVPLPLTILIYIAALLLLYFLTAEIVKHYFFKKFEL